MDSTKSSHYSFQFHLIHPAITKIKTQFSTSADWYNSLFRKLLFPIGGFMLITLLVTGAVFSIGIQNTTKKLLESELRSNNEKIVTSLQSRINTVQSASKLLAINSDIESALPNDNATSIAVINNLALIIQNRFDLDLIQVYSGSGQARTNLERSSLNKVSSVVSSLQQGDSGLVELQGRLVYLSHEHISGGGDIYTGIDMLSELNRITLQLGLQDNLSIEKTTTPTETIKFINGVYTLRTPVTIGGETVLLVHSQQMAQFETIAHSGRNIILISIITISAVLIIMMAIILRGIIQPIRSLANAAQKLAQADFNTVTLDQVQVIDLNNPFKIGVNDEIGQLAGSFMHMSLELKDTFQGLVRDLRRTNDELNAAYDSALQGWSSALELRDHDTEKFCERVSEDVVSLAKFMGVPEEKLVHYRRGALLHDVGKMAIPDAILNKSGPLTDNERQIMRQHPIYAYVMLRKVSYLKEALEIPYCHHERWDGKGYPRGLFRTEIPLSARIFRVVDTWNSMRVDTTYRKGFPALDVKNYIISNSASEFDPAVVNAFLSWLREEENKKRVV